MKEIERKFLIDPQRFVKTANATVMSQGYLSVDPERVVRVRVEGEQAWLTIKGKISGVTRDEFEYPVPVADARQLLLLAVFPPVEKIRHRVKVEGFLWEVDEFLGANQGLWLAEIELEDENQLFVRPEWLGSEVTHDRRYYNSQLAQFPFSQW
ncbi:MAG TPA: CYTH domain-containing protein [Prolixibacteraceae bacterium]|nr:CYTH domain-containing protein [Prolixibacteraceae bacterium]